jgi:hypothetical protein
MDWNAFARGVRKVTRLRPIDFPAVVLALLVAALSSTSSNGAPAATQPVLAGRDTPAGAMTVFEHAVQNGDLATAADSYNLPAGSAYMHAARDIAGSRLFAALQTRWGADAAQNIFSETGLSRPPPQTNYSAGNWTISPSQADVAVGKTAVDGSVSFPDLQRGSDGIWRMGAISAAPTPPPALVEAMKTRAAQLTTQYDSLIADIQSGKYSQPDNVINALTPPQVARAQADQRQIQQAVRKQQEDQDQLFLAQQFDGSSLNGAVGLYLQAMLKSDGTAMAAFYYVDKSTDDRFASAYAQRILTAIALNRAVADYIRDAANDNLAGDFGLLPEIPDYRLGGMTLHEQGDRGIVAWSGPPDLHTSIWFRKVGGVWKQEIAPPPGTSLEDATAAMIEDNAAVARITAQIISGNLKHTAEVRDALGDAVLSETPDPQFLLNSMRVSAEGVLQMPTSPPPRTDHPTNRNSPAGAMNVFVAAMRSLNTAVVADSLYMPTDKDGATHLSAARNLIAGYGFLQAANARFGAAAAQPISYWCGSLQPWILDPYVSGDWLIEPQYPGLAFLNSLTGANNNFAYRSGLIVHRCPDGFWRVGPRFPKNPRQLKTLRAALDVQSAKLEQAIIDINAGKYAGPQDLINAMGPSPLGQSPSCFW